MPRARQGLGMTACDADGSTSGKTSEPPSIRGIISFLL
jgi:hypothetical protein